MIIRLTSIESFEQVLEKLKKDPFYDDQTNTTFFKYCVNEIKEGLLKGDDEWYLNIEWKTEPGKIVLLIRYYRRSEILTDKEYIEN